MKIIYIKSHKRKPAIFLDRDGVINRDISGKYITSFSDVSIYALAIEGLRKIDFKKYHIIIITNQSAIGRGYMSIKMAEEINNKIVCILKKKGIIINAVYYCPHSPNENCKCRKPKIGLIEQAQKDYKIDMRNSFFIGDKKTDMDMALKLGVTSIFLLTGQGRTQLKKYGNINVDYVLKNLKNISKIIC